MKKALKSVMTIALVLLIVQACMPFAAAAGTTTTTADFSVSNYAGLVETVARQYIARDTAFTVKYTASLSEVQNNISNNNHFWDDIFAVDVPDTVSDKDYLHNNMSEMRISWRYSGTSAICELAQTYLSTATHEKYVNSTVAAILSKLDLAGDSVYGKIKAIHDYIVDNVEYDFTYNRYTAYDALYAHSAVCQGYSLLMYKMLMEAGVPVRIITGEAVADGARGPHAWNIVKIGSYWYNLDVTWDDSFSSTKYMLKSNANFPDHYRDSKFSSSAFNASYPMSPVNFDLTQDVKLVDSISLTNSQGSSYAVGSVFLLSASVNPIDATNQALSWSSSNPGVASVDNTGHVTINAAGSAVITAKATDGTGKTAKFTVTAYVIDTPSPWAINDINALSARGVIPPDISAAYKNNITRAEFMALIANVYQYAKGPCTPPASQPFTDIALSAYKNEILIGYQLGVIEGMGSNLFGPDNTLTREQCAKIVSNAVKVISGAAIASNAALSYADISLISPWALPYVRYAYESGLMQGCEGNFNPQEVLTREQAMLVAERMIKKYNW